MIKISFNFDSGWVNDSIFNVPTYLHIKEHGKRPRSVGYVAFAHACIICEYVVVIIVVNFISVSPGVAFRYGGPIYNIVINPYSCWYRCESINIDWYREQHMIISW